MNDCEQNFAKNNNNNFMLKNALFSVLVIPVTHFERKCTETSAEDDILHRIFRYYTFIEVNPSVVNIMPQ
jgi:hypothetical protein